MAMSTPPLDVCERAAPNAPADQNHDEISLLNILTVLWRKRLLWGTCSLLVALVAFGITLTLPNKYTATSRILPPQQSSSTAAALFGQLGALSGIAGGAIPSVRNPNEVFVGMLKSQTIAERLIQRYELMPYFRETSKDIAVRHLGRVSSIFIAKDGIISISVEMSDPDLAAELANAYVEELFRLSRSLAVSEASQRRLFLERQLESTREQISTAELEARAAINEGGFAMVEAQSRSMIDASARLRAQLTAKEVQIGGMRAFATDTNPEFQLAQRELQALRAELMRIEQAPSEAMRATARPGSANTLRLLRELKYREALQELLARQVEVARIEEARDIAALQVLDAARAPDTKSSPNRAAIVIVASFVAALVAAAYVVGCELIRRRHPSRI
jgi:tyrosine-protein kinase Etk/Wzc